LTFKPSTSQVDLQAFYEVGATVAIVGTVTESDIKGTFETGLAVTVTATVAQVDQADFKESLTVAGVATVTQSDTFTPSPASSTQLGYRFRQDSGNALNSSTGWLAALNTAQFRVRILIKNDGSTAFPATEDWVIQARVNAGAWTAINLLGIYTTSTGEYAGGDPTTQLLGSGTFEAGAGIESDTEALNYDLAGGAETEFEWVFSMPDFGEVFSSDTIDFRVVDGVGTPLDTITETPTFTVINAFVESRSIGGIVATVTSTDAKGVTESVTVTVVATVTQADVYTPGSVNYDETGRAVTIVGTVSEVNSMVLAEEGAAVAIVATVAEADDQFHSETGLAVTIVATVTETDTKLLDERGRTVAGVVTVTQVDRADFANPVTVPVVATITEVDRADFKEAPTVLFTVVVSAVSSTDQADFDETGRSVGIVGTVTESNTFTPSPASSRQLAYRLRDDSVALNADAGWLAALNTPYNYPISDSTQFRIRVLMRNDGGTAFPATEDWIMEARVNAGAWTAINLLGVYTTSSAYYAGNDPTTQLLGSGTFEAGAGMEGDTEILNYDLAADAETEFEWAFSIPDFGEVFTGDVIEFRVVDAVGNPPDIIDETPSMTMRWAYVEQRSVPVVGTVTSTDVQARFESVTVPVVATVTQVDVFTPNLGVSYDETGRTVSIVATVTEVDQADFKESPAVLFTVVVSAVSSTDQADFDETGRAVTIVGTVSETDSKGYDETGLAVVVVGTVTQTEAYTIVEATTVTGIGTVTQVGQADFDETAKTVSIVATVTQVDVYTPTTLDETGRLVDIIGTVTESNTHTPSAAALEQRAYRWREDTFGLNVDDGWLAALNVSPKYDYFTASPKIRLRMVLFNDGGTDFPATTDWRFESRINAEAWVAINVDGTYTTSTSQYANLDPTTQILGSDSFEAGVGLDSDSEWLNDDLAGGKETELEIVLILPDFGELVTGDVVEFRVTHQEVAEGFQPPDTITQTPSLTIFAAYSEITNLVPVIGTVTETDQADFDETGASVSIVGNVTQNDVYTTAPALLEQLHYRWKTDTVGLNVDSAWLAALDTPGPAYNILSNDKVRLRMVLRNDGNTAFPSTTDMRFAARVNAGPWTAINTVGIYTTSSPEYANGDPTTQVIGTGTFEAGVGLESTVLTENADLAADAETELEIVLIMPDFAELVSGDIVEFRVEYQEVAEGFNPADTTTVTPTLVAIYFFDETSRFVNITGTVTQTSQADWLETGKTVAIVSTVTQNDTYTPNLGENYDETGRSVAITGTITETDEQGYNESATSVSGIVTITETHLYTNGSIQNYDETGLIVTGNATITVGDTLGLTENTTVAGIATVTQQEDFWSSAIDSGQGLAQTVDITPGGSTITTAGVGETIDPAGLGTTGA